MSDRLRPNEYNSQPQNPDDMSRRRFLRGAWKWGVAVPATVGGAIAFYNWALPKIGDALGSIQLPQLSGGNSSDQSSNNLLNNPDSSPTPDPNLLYPKDGRFQVVFPAESITWEECVGGENNSNLLGLMIHVNKLTSSQNVIYSPAIDGSTQAMRVESYAPPGKPIDAWHDLLLSKKTDLVNRYGAGTEFQLVVETSDSGYGSIAIVGDSVMEYKQLVNVRETIADIK